MSLEYQATLMREHFVNCLRPALKRIVLISDPSDFNKAIEVAKGEEINDHVVNGTAPWTQTFCNAEPPVAPVAAISSEKLLHDRIHRPENTVEKLTTALTESKISPGPPNYGRRYNWSSDRNLRSTDGLQICNFCKKVGNYERECRSKRSFLDHDVLLIKEILVFRPFALKFGSRERGEGWDKIADTLNTVQQVRFSVDQRGVRERYAKLEKAYKKKTREEHQASGISPEITELDQGFETIIEMTESAQIEVSETKKVSRNNCQRIRKLQKKLEHGIWKGLLRQRQEKGRAKRVL